MELSCELYTKIQKMKAIHNCGECLTTLLDAVNYTQRYKKWKQFTTNQQAQTAYNKLWTIHKDTKNESNSQLAFFKIYCDYCCELYTTTQKMKAIHNMLNNRASALRLWTIHKDTKNESNSQQYRAAAFMIRGCELYTKIQKMKAIHNRGDFGKIRGDAVNYTQRYKKWKQFTTAREGLVDGRWLWTIHKDTRIISINLVKYAAMLLGNRFR